MSFNIIKSINLDMTLPNAIIVNAVQYDSSGRIIKANLLNNGVSWTVPSNCYPVIRYRKSDRIGGFYDVDENGSYAISFENNRQTIDITLALQVLTTIGNVDIQINFYNTLGQRVTSFAFKVKVQASVIPDSEIISSEYYNALTATLKQVVQAGNINDLTNRAEVAAANAESAASNAASEVMRTVPAQVSAWLADNMSNPSNPAVDASLSVQGAAADAKATGKLKSSLSYSYPCIAGYDNIDDKPQLKAIKALYFDFEDGSIEKSFWDGTHTYNGNSYKRNIGVAIISNTALSFYWFNDEGKFIAGNSAFEINKTAEVIGKYGSNYLYSKSLTLDNTDCTMYALIDWNYTAGASGLYNGCYSKNDIAIQGEIVNMLVSMYKKPFVICPDAVSDDIITNVVDNGIFSLYIDFENIDDSDFWNGTHTYNGNSYKRNIGLTIIENDSLSFYWLNNDQHFIAGNQAFKIDINKDVVNSNDSIKLLSKRVSLDGFIGTIYLVTDTKFITAGSRVYQTRYIKEQRNHNKWASLLINYVSPFIPNYDQQINSVLYDILSKGIQQFYLQFDDIDDSDFWNGTHTYNGNSYKRNIGFTYIAADSSIQFYWLNNNSDFIAGDRALYISPIDDVVLKSGTLKILRKRVTLDGLSATAYALIDTTFIPTEAVGNYQTVYMKEWRQKWQQLAIYGNYNPDQIKLLDLNLGVDGDSITAGNQWSYYLYKKLGFKTHHNVGVGSSQWQDECIVYNGTEYWPQIYGETGWIGMSDGYGTIPNATEAQKRANNSAKNHILKFIDEVNSGDYPEPDLFIFALGTNDDIERLGTVEDAFSQAELPDVNDPILKTTAGSMRWCIQKLMETYPNCRIAIQLPIHSAIDSRENANIIKIPIFRAIAEKFALPIIDQWNNSGISAFMETSDGTSKYLRDGVHPTELGKKMMANCSCSVVSTMFFIEKE